MGGRGHKQQEYNPDRTEVSLSSVFRFSALAEKMQPSPIRELFQMIQRPGMISFAGGLPDPDTFPVEAFASCSDVLERDGRTVLQYGASEGYPPLRDAILDMMEIRLGYRPAAGELLVTSGSQQAVDLIGRALLDPGDVVVLEAPTYPGTLHCLRNAGARFALVPSDGDGMLVEMLPEVITRVTDATGRRPKLIYTVPDFSNPSGACMSLERRRPPGGNRGRVLRPGLRGRPLWQAAVLRRAAANSEDTGRRCTARHLRLLLFKVLAPGVRVAWTVAAPELIRSMVLMRQGEDLCTSTVTQALVAEYCTRGLLEEHLGLIVATFTPARAAPCRGLEQHLPAGAATWHQPQGGFFFWLELASGNSRSLFDRGVEAKVAFVTGKAFFPDADEQVGEVLSGDRFARLCSTFADEAAIEEGCRRLGAVMAG